MHACGNLFEMGTQVASLKHPKVEDSPISRHDFEMDPLLGQRDWLTGVVVKRLGCSEAVEDVLQEIALAVSRESNQIRAEPTKPLSTTKSLNRFWLCRVALRQSALWLRTQIRLDRKHKSPEIREKALERAESDPLFALIGSETAEIFRREWQDLDISHRQILHLKILEGKTYKEIGQILGISVHSVEHRLDAARRCLRLKLVRAGIDGNDGSARNE
jgi:RNA polymerase sigma factor (sigma-70 family)